MLVALAILFLAVGSHAGIIKNYHDVGPEPIEIEEAPFQAQISARKPNFTMSIFCGGSIIAKNVILTNAMCVALVKVKDINVRVGSKYWGNEGIEYNVSQYKMHEGFAYNCLQYDIALIWLSKNLEYSDKVARIALPLPGDTISNGTMSTVTGWEGYSLDFTDKKDLLLKAVVPINNREECDKAYFERLLQLREDMMCAGHIEKERNTPCLLFGSPLVFNGTQWGIMSWTVHCVTTKFPGVYTSVAYLREWINQHVEFD